MAAKKARRAYTIYILECLDGSLYTGITTDLSRRFAEHAAGVGARYTRARGVKSVLYSEQCKTRSLALRREAEIKKLPRTHKVALITKKRESQ